MQDLKIAVVVASLGRPVEVRQLLDRLRLQTLKPSLVVLSVTKTSDIPEQLEDDVRVLMGTPGSSVQRNRGIDIALADEADVVIFFDDDYVPTIGAVELFCRVLHDNPDVVGVNGTVIADGIHGPGIDFDDALALVQAREACDEDSGAIWGELDGLYGCNMAFRASAIGHHRFDERLPLYAWQEDIDFSRQVRSTGRLVRTRAGSGVHRGVKRARTSGFVFGWAQIVNPVYLVRKGTMPLGFALNLMARNFAANHLRLLAPEPWVDRRGRARGNWAGVASVLRGRTDPSELPAQSAK